MLIIFESILPIFLLVVLGGILKRSTFIDDGLWPGLEQFGFYVLFPAFLFLSLARANFGGIEAGTISLVAILAVLAMSTLVLALWPLFSKAGVTGGSFTSVFQTTTRWNAFVALAIAEKVSGPTGLAIVALVMASIIIPINLINVGVLIWFSGARRDFGAFVKRIVANPLIIGCGLGLALNLSGLTPYEPLMMTVDLVARASLGLGLIMVGAGLKIADALKPRPLAILSVMLKLTVFPAIMLAVAMVFGIEGEALAMLALSAGVPTAMHGYLLAKQMGGDAPLYAAVATLQTAAAFVTIPLLLMVVR